MMFVLIIITTIIFLLAGYSMLEFGGFLKKESILAKLSYSWGLGVGIVGLQLFFYSICNISWNLINILLPWTILFAIFFFKKRLPKFKKTKLKLSRLEIFFTLLILLLLFFTGFESVLRPVHAWDGWDNWVFRPKVFYLHNNLNLDYVRYTNDEYPLIIPLMGTFGYILMGGINDTYILFLFFMFYLTLGVLFFSYTKKQLGTKQALVWTFLLLSLQNLIRHGGRYEVGQADLALGYYFFAGIALLTNFIETKNTKTLLLLSVFLGISSQIKDDGVPYFLVMNTILFIMLLIWKKYRYLLFLLPSIFLLLPWEIYKKFYHFPTSALLANGIHVHLTNSITIASAMGKEFVNFQNWSILWIVFFVTLLVCFKKLGKVKIVLLVFIFQWLSYFSGFMLLGHAEEVIDKLYIHLAPMAVLIIAILLKENLQTLKKISWKKYIE